MRPSSHLLSGSPHMSDQTLRLLRSPVAALAVVTGVIVAAVVVAIGAPVWMAVPVAVVVSTAGVALVDRRPLEAVEAGLGGRLATGEEFPRYHNIVDGLCLSHGIARPDLQVLDSPSVNAAVAADGRSSVLLVTTGALEVLGAVELEGLLAHALVRCRDRSLVAETKAAFWGRLPGGAGLPARIDDADTYLAADAAGVALTRYPPGLVRALTAADVSGSRVDAAPTTAHLWLVRPGISASAHPTIDLRVAALGEC